MKNTSQFMDKQIMDLSSSSPPSTDFIDLMNKSTDSLDGDHHLKQRIGDNGLDSSKDEIVPSYDFQPIRPSTAVGLSHSALDLAAGSTTCTAAKALSASDFKPISTSPNRVVPEMDPSVSIMCEIDRTMKKHVDTLLRAMERVSARLTQLETRTHNLENLVDDLKVSVDKSHGSTHGIMRQLENILVEVQRGVQVLKNKQEFVEPQLHVSKVDPKTHSDPLLAPLPMPQFPLSHQILQPPSSQLLARLPSQFSPQQDPFCPSLPNQLPYLAPPQQEPPSSGYDEQAPPYAMQSYLPNPHPQQATAGSAPSQHLYNASRPQPSTYDGADGRSNSRFPPGYSSESYTYTAAKPPHMMSSSGTSYPPLSNSHHALPMAAAGNGSSSPRSESRVPIDDVIDRVTTMGFPRDQVRETVRKLTENGQAVDLNVVLDKLMNG